MNRALTIFTVAVLAATQVYGADIVHDAEYYVLERQHAKQWAADDQAVEAKLREIRDKNGGKPPNILYILIDDIGFGEIGEPYLNYVRGYQTPNINQFANEGLRFMRMYTEPSCTPTRVAFMTGRQPWRLGMAHTSVAMDGFGMADEEVTLAEVLKAEGYNTAHVGKWHIGDTIRGSTMQRSRSTSRASSRCFRARATRRTRRSAPTTPSSTISGCSTVVFGRFQAR